MKSSRGFTWSEVLVLLVVLFVLLVLIPPPFFGGVLDATRRAQAKNDTVQIANAVEGFKTEYDRFPSTNADIQDVGGPFLQALMGANTDLNPRKIVFLEVQTAKKGKSGLRDGAFVDPWGFPYKVKLDTDGDRKITNAGSTQHPMVEKIVAVWNDPSVHSDSASDAKKRKRYVNSWE